MDAQYYARHVAAMKQRLLWGSGIGTGMTAIALMLPAGLARSVINDAAAIIFASTGLMVGYHALMRSGL